MAARASGAASWSNSSERLWKRQLFDEGALAAFDRIRIAVKSGRRTGLCMSALLSVFSFPLLTHSLCPSGRAIFNASPPTSLNADITTVYRAITVNEEIVIHLANKQEGLKEESLLELDMKGMLELEVKRLEESLAIYKREIKNIVSREETRQYELAELKDLGLVMLVQALRQETPEE